MNHNRTLPSAPPEDTSSWTLRHPTNEDDNFGQPQQRSKHKPKLPMRQQQQEFWNEYSQYQQSGKIQVAKLDTYQG
jgi:hypothetical protein